MATSDRLNVKVIEKWVRDTAAGADVPAKLGDGHGLSLVRSGNARTGSPIWRYKYALDAAERLCSIGPYPEVTLEQARIARDEARAMLRETPPRDPVQERRQARVAARVTSGTTFAVVAALWLAARRDEWSAIHYQKTDEQLRKHVLPTLGPLAVDAITPSMVAAVIGAIVKRGAKPTAKKTLYNVRQIFDLAQTRPDALQRPNPAHPAHAMIGKAKPVQHHPALLTLPALGKVLVAIDRAPLSPAVRMCHRLVAFAAPRISNAVAARWSQFDLDAARPTWTIARGEMKKAHDRQHDHVIYLGPTLVRDLREWRAIAGSTSDYCFAPLRAGTLPHITRESLEKGYRVTLKLDGTHSAHGWRASFSTLCREQGGFDETVVELALDHIAKTAVVRAYDRGERLEQRVALLAWWDRELTQAEQAAKGGAR